MHSTPVDVSEAYGGTQCSACISEIWEETLPLVSVGRMWQHVFQRLQSTGEVSRWECTNSTVEALRVGWLLHHIGMYAHALVAMALVGYACTYVDTHFHTYCLAALHVSVYTGF